MSKNTEGPKVTAHDIEEAIQWLETITGHTLQDQFAAHKQQLKDKDFESMTGISFVKLLKNGVVLCSTLDAVKPGICGAFVKNPKHWLEEKENIRKFIECCKRLGVPSHDLIDEYDVTDGRPNPTQALYCLHAISRQAQAHGFTGPQLGARFYQSVKQQQERQKKRQEEIQRERVQEAQKREAGEKRRQEVEKESKDRENVIETERKTRFQKRAQKWTTQGVVLKKEPIRDEHKSQSLAVFGMDLEHHKKMQEHYSYDDEEKVFEWIETVSGYEVDTWDSLKTGRILCIFVNQLRPGSVPHVNQQQRTLHEKENLQKFLEACKRLGLTTADMCDVEDIFHSRNPRMLLNMFFTLSRLLESSDSYDGHIINRSAPPLIILKPSRVPSSHVSRRSLFSRISSLFHRIFPRKKWLYITSFWMGIDGCMVLSNSVVPTLIPAVTSYLTVQNAHPNVYYATNIAKYCCSYFLPFFVGVVPSVNSWQIGSLLISQAALLTLTTRNSNNNNNNNIISKSFSRWSVLYNVLSFLTILNSSNYPLNNREKIFRSIFSAVMAIVGLFVSVDLPSEPEHKNKTK